MSEKNKEQYAYDDGYSAYMNGVSVRENPYVGIGSKQWSLGWYDAQDDSFVDPFPFSGFDELE